MRDISVGGDPEGLKLCSIEAPGNVDSVDAYSPSPGNFYVLQIQVFKCRANTLDYLSSKMSWEKSNFRYALFN